MDPKDLKNSEELKSTEPTEPKQQENAVDFTDKSVEKMENEKVENQEVVNTISDKLVTESSVGIEELKETPEVGEKGEDGLKESSPEVEIEKVQLEVSENSDQTVEEEPVEIAQQPEKEEDVALSENKTELASEGKITESGKPEVKNSVEEATPAPVTKEKEKEVIKPVVIDYSSLSQIELINAFRELLDENTGKDIKNIVETIKSQFYKLLTVNLKAQKDKFIEDGGVEEDFRAEEDPYERDIKDLLKRYRNLRFEYNKKQELSKEDNLQLKYKVIEDIKNLINREESINKTFQEFRDLQYSWRNIGLVPQSKMKDLWDTYHFHVENFYDYIKINKELRDLDLKKNLEIKIILCERAEELLVEPSIIKAFNSLQKLHERWREAGPVPRDKKDEIWDRFKSVTSKINKKHQDFFEDRKSEQRKNLEAKEMLCDKAEEISKKEMETHKEWDVSSRELVELQKVWRTIGFAPKRDNVKIYERFRVACDKFFDSKREYYGRNKEQQQNNLQLKIDLCVQAESLKDSTDWKKTTQDFINIQRKWKEIGSIPRKHSDQVWKRFRAACDSFFEMKSKHFSHIDIEQVDNLKLKEDLIEEVTNYVASKDVDVDLKFLKDFQRKWTEIGHVPIKQKDSIQNKFREAINRHFDDLKLDDSKRNMLKFRNKVSNFSETSRGVNKMMLERDKFAAKLKQMENDLILLDNNIGFFTHSKNAESLIADVNAKIEQTREKIKFLKNKIKIIDEYETESE